MDTEKSELQSVDEKNQGTSRQIDAEHNGLLRMTVVTEEMIDDYEDSIIEALEEAIRLKEEREKMEWHDNLWNPYYSFSKN